MQRVPEQPHWYVSVLQHITELLHFQSTSLIPANRTPTATCTAHQQENRFSESR